MSQTCRSTTPRSHAWLTVLCRHSGLRGFLRRYLSTPFCPDSASPRTASASHSPAQAHQWVDLHPATLLASKNTSALMRSACSDVSSPLAQRTPGHSIVMVSDQPCDAIQLPLMGNKDGVHTHLSTGSSKHCAVDDTNLWRQIEGRRTSMIYSAWQVEKEKLIELLHSPGHYAIEIGSFGGSTSRTLGFACRALDKKLVCIDPWEDDLGKQQFPKYLEAISDLQDSVITIRARSCEAVQMLPDDLPGNVCLLFIDGNHIYPEPLRDMQCYWPLLAKGAAMAVHDIFDVWWHGNIFRSITEFFYDKPGYCLEAINYIPSIGEAEDAEHHCSGLVWVFKGKLRAV